MKKKIVSITTSTGTDACAITMALLHYFILHSEMCELIGAYIKDIYIQCIGIYRQTALLTHCLHNTHNIIIRQSLQIPLLSKCTSNVKYSLRIISNMCN